MLGLTDSAKKERTFHTSISRMQCSKAKKG